ncbi:hypothetical protein SteCoe_13406 [Stentor coeruleus]|uniref:HTH La-type RNA-binding domain-containing protein n=1 Tax=Stentor coeruleus TaxID=5963 RepID=A0A1R2C8L8_9CILI|nr:hypothetical protein SteCoe_13406 [Stentor coeruleus]
MDEAETDKIQITFKVPSSYLDSDLVRELKRLFSLENLEKDYCMVMNMDNDLWVSMDFLLNLESIKLICTNEIDLLCACYQAGLELSNGFTRNKIEIPRKVLYIHENEALQDKLSSIKCEKSTKEGQNWLLHFNNESEALGALEQLKSFGYDCSLDYANPYVYLCASATNYLKENLFYAVDSLFFKNKSKVYSYSIEDIKDMYAKTVIKMPRVFKKFEGLSIILDSPREIDFLK